MKKLLTLTLAAFSTATFASSLVCSGERIYKSSVRADFGTRPPDGAVLGSQVIVHDGKVLLSHEDIEGLHVHGFAPYELSFENDMKVLEEVTASAHFDKTYRVTGVLNRIDSFTGDVLEELAREKVTCRAVQNFVP